MSPTRSHAAALVLAVLVCAGEAAAEPAEGRLELRPLTAPRGMFELTFGLETNLSTREAFEPTSIAPDMHYGVTDALTLGLVHSARAVGLIDSGHGLCLRSEAAGCERIYNGVAVDVLFALRDGDAALAARSRIAISDFDPFKLSWRPGVLFRGRHRRFSAIVDPHFSFGLSNRDRGNAHAFNLPITFAASLGSRVSIRLMTGFRGALSGFSEKYAVRFGLGLSVAITDSIDLGAEAAFERLLGPLNSPKPRHAVFYVSWRRAIARGK